MGIPKKIKINNGKDKYGNETKKEYYYWDEYETHEEAIYYAKKIKNDRRRDGLRLKYFILEAEDSWFLPVPKFVVYLNKKLKIF